MKMSQVKVKYNHFVICHWLCFSKQTRSLQISIKSYIFNFPLLIFFIYFISQSQAPLDSLSSSTLTNPPTPLQVEKGSPLGYHSTLGYLDTVDLGISSPTEGQSDSPSRVTGSIFRQQSQRQPLRAMISKASSLGYYKRNEALVNWLCWVKVMVTKTDNLNLILRAHIEKGKNWLVQLIL